MSDIPPQVVEPCTACGQLIDVTDVPVFSEVICPNCQAELRVRRKFNNFHLEDLIGEGGMGSVFKATDLNLQRLVALKILKRETGSTELDWQKLAQEARVTASINHPHVVKVFSFGEDNGQFYLAMELVAKGSLDDLMQLQGSVAEAQVLTVGIQIAEGLQAALERGLLHRDVKPANILFADANTSKIVDFGLALLLDEEAQERGEIWGTPYYIAPEKLDNRPEDYRSDLYSLGGTLFHALAGRPPFEASTASMVALKHIKSQAVSLQAFAPDISSETAYVINRMLQKDPDDRYQSYDELIGHLTYARNKLVERTQQPNRRKERVQVETKQTRAVVGVVWMVTLLCVLAGAVALFAFRDQIFGSGKPASQSISAKDVREAKDIETDARNAFLERNFARAAEGFGAAAALVGELQPNLNWALAQQGLSLLMSGQVRESQALFENLESAGLYSLEASDQKLANFFVELGRLMSDSKAIRGGTGRLYSHENFEVFALLAYGLKDFELGEMKDAELLLKSFTTAKPQGSSEWIMSYQPLAMVYLEDVQVFRKLERQSDQVTAETLNDFVAQVQAAQQMTVTGDTINEALRNLVGRTRKKIVQ